MFKGIRNLSIDVKGRASMTQRYRRDFREKNKCKLVITADKDKCLLIYTQIKWEGIEKKLSNLPSYNKEARLIQRLLIGYATESEIDSQGRFLIPNPLSASSSSTKLPIWSPIALNSPLVKLPFDVIFISNPFASLTSTSSNNGLAIAC